MTVDGERRKRTADTTAGLIALALLLSFVVPDRYALGPSGIRLTTYTLFGAVFLLMWIIGVLIRSNRSVDRLNPIRIGILLLIAEALVMMATAYRRVLSPLEDSGTVRQLFITVTVSGIGLLMCDYVRSTAGIRKIVGWLLFGGYVSALVALLQKLIHFDYIAAWGNVPGLSTGVDVPQTVVLLSGRSVGTALHPIEFSVACACLLPLAINQTRHAIDHREVVFHRLGAGLLGIGCLIGISRSGAIGLAIVVLLTLRQLTPRQRANLLGAGLVILAFVQVAVHGVLSTLRYQFTHIGNDASSTGRTKDYTVVFKALVDQHPWTGIGLGTFNPAQYLYLDNSWLGQLVQGGIIGVAVVGLVYLAAIYFAATVRRRLADPYMSGVVQAAGTMLVVIIACAYFFDEFTFGQPTVLTYVALGLIGSGYRMLSVRQHVEDDLAAGADRDVPVTGAHRLVTS